jgi:Holliday junction resolvase
MGKKSRDKGKVGEREVAQLLRSYGIEARRGQQFRGGKGSPDVIHTLEGLHIEVKRTEGLGLYSALEQADTDRRDTELPVVFHRKNGRRWVTIMYAEDYLELLGHSLQEDKKDESEG